LHYSASRGKKRQFKNQLHPLRHFSVVHSKIQDNVQFLDVCASCKVVLRSQQLP